MVKGTYWILFIWIVSLAKLGAEPLIEATVNSSRSQANYPLEGVLTITHDKQEKIDARSAKLEGKPLDILFVKDVLFSSGESTLISIYNFQLPAQPKGLYVLPAISIQVDGKVYSSIPSAYEVNDAEGKLIPLSKPSQEQKSNQSKKQENNSPLIFNLEAEVKGPSTLYPGQRTLLFYRISYNRNVDLSHSELPLIHPAHFRKVGDVQIRDAQQQELTLQDLTQEIEASELGTYELGPSSIEGYAYTLDLSGKKVYAPELLRAEAPIITLQVKPFPVEDQPPSFTGAIGKIKAEIELNSASSLPVGDNLQLSIKIQGITNLADLRLPSLMCQPGFSGFFQSSDLPPLAEIDQANKTKTFHVELRPLTTFIQALPSIQLSSFDPTSGKYSIQESEPIKISIVSNNMYQSKAPTKMLSPQLVPDSKLWPTPVLSPLELDNQPEEIAALSFSWLKGAWVLWMLPIGISLLLIQREWHRRRLQSPKPQIKKSEILLQEALRAPSLNSIHLLEEALWCRLAEKGIISKEESHLEKLPVDGVVGNVRALLYSLQAAQYSDDKMYDLSKLRSQTKELFSTF